MSYSWFSYSPVVSPMQSFFLDYHRPYHVGVPLPARLRPDSCAPPKILARSNTPLPRDQIRDRASMHVVIAHRAATIAQSVSKGFGRLGTEHGLFPSYVDVGVLLECRCTRQRSASRPHPHAAPTRCMEAGKHCCCQTEYVAHSLAWAYQPTCSQLLLDFYGLI